MWKYDFANPFSTFQAQILVKTDTYFDPKTTNIDDYDIMYSIAHLAPQPVSLDSLESYEHFVETLKRNRSGSGLVIYVTQKAADVEDKENPAPVNNNKKSKKKKSKLKTCGKHACGSKLCWIDPENPTEHLCLTFEHLDYWVAAMLDGKETATLEKPPNHQLFMPAGGANLRQCMVLQQHQA
ncbi:hypothetical protein BT96DRAFT_938155 [Gymnopus androsaceus JB14]|uniref:Uncharacterized protein n=1 Tax=Gymnopus androsaceus JB14 TaxID=1447944 RepID=A0A6A4HVS2_9AGAR|nr:hypothetical protein BT96DRAFT_938155 [Gymnopus androsaceus JB14]